MKLLWENIVGNYCEKILAGKFLQENPCGKISRKNIAGNSGGKFLRENLA